MLKYIGTEAIYLCRQQPKSWWRRKRYNNGSILGLFNRSVRSTNWATVYRLVSIWHGVVFSHGVVKLVSLPDFHVFDFCILFAFFLFRSSFASFVQKYSQIELWGFPLWFINMTWCCFLNKFNKLRTRTIVIQLKAFTFSLLNGNWFSCIWTKCFLVLRITKRGGGGGGRRVLIQEWFCFMYVCSTLKYPFSVNFWFCREE